MNRSSEQVNDAVVPDIFDVAENRASRYGPVASDRARILLAEDDHEMRRFLAEELCKSGYTVLAVQNGYGMVDFIEKGLACDAGVAFDVVISDIRMPGSNGLRILSALHAYDPKLPVILITAFGNPETHEEARLRGAIAVLDKPFSFSELLNQIQSVLRRNDPS